MPNGQSIVSKPTGRNDVNIPSYAAGNSSQQFDKAPREGGIRGWFKRGPEGQHDSNTCPSCGTKWCSHCGGQAHGLSGPEMSCPTCGVS